MSAGTADELVESALAELRRRGLSRAVLVLPAPLSECATLPPGVTPVVASDRAALARARGTVLLVGPREMADRRLLVVLARSGRGGFLCRVDGRWVRVSLAAAAAWIVSDSIRQRVTAGGSDDPLVRAARALRRLPGLRRVWRAVARGGGRADWIPDVAELSALRAALAAAAPRPPPVRPPSGPRVALVIATLGAGGAERQLVNLALSLVARGFAASVIVTERSGAGFDFHRPALEAAGIEVIAALPGSGGALTGALAAMPRELGERVAALARATAAVEADVLHAWQDGPAAAAALAAPLAGVRRVVVGFRNVAPIHFPDCRPYWRPLFAMLAARDDAALVANSRTGRASYADWLGIGPDRIAVIANGLDAQSVAVDPAAVGTARARLAGPDETLVGGVFRLAGEKRPELWLDAVARLAATRTDLRFVLVGDGPMRAAFESRATAQGLAGRLTILAPTPDVGAVIAACDVLLHAADREGTPNVLIEAQALGRPIVAAACPGVAETLTPAPWARQVAADGAEGPGALAQAVLEVLADPDLAARAAAEGPSWVAGHFALVTTVAATAELYGWPARVDKASPASS